MASSAFGAYLREFSCGKLCLKPKERPMMRLLKNYNVIMVKFLNCNVKYNVARNKICKE